jgi:hypothetical protein
VAVTREFVADLKARRANDKAWEVARRQGLELRTTPDKYHYTRCMRRRDVRESLGEAKTIGYEIVLIRSDAGLHVGPHGSLEVDQNALKIITGLQKSGAPEIWGPCSIEHFEHAHRRGCFPTV